MDLFGIIYFSGMLVTMLLAGAFNAYLVANDFKSLTQRVDNDLILFSLFGLMALLGWPLLLLAVLCYAFFALTSKLMVLVLTKSKAQKLEDEKELIGSYRSIKK